MATLQEIASAIKSIEEKKQNLRNAFEDLQNHSHSLSSFSLSWPEIDSHFSQIQSSLQSRFSLLQKNEQSFPQSEQNPENPVLENPPNPEIKSICEKMEASRLMNWVKKNGPKWNNEGLIELGRGLKCAPDPFKLVLDAIDDGVHPKGKASAVLLEGLVMAKGVNISGEMRGRAKNLSVKWKEEVDKGGKNPLEVLGFLCLLGCYRLVEEFGEDDVVEFVHIGVKNAKTIKLCRVLGLENIVPGVVQKLISEGKRLMAIRFICEFKLEERFSPVELLRSYLKDAKKLAQQIRKKGKSSSKSLDQADEKELNALKTVLRYIRDFKFESEYPPESIEKQIKQLEELRANRKSTVAIQPAKKNQQKQKGPKKQLQTRSKQPVPRAAPVPAVTSGISTNIGVSPLRQPQLPYGQLPVLSAGQSVLAPSIGSYPFSGSLANTPYSDPANLLYGLASTLVAYAGNPASGGSHVYASGSQLPSSSYKGPSPSEGYVYLPQPHLPYRPQ